MKTVKTFTNQGYQPELRQAYESVFVDVPYPEGPRFTANMTARALLYPVNPELRRTEFEALIKATQAVDDDALCISLLLQAQDRQEVNHWWISLTDPEAYFSLRAWYVILPNAIYSPKGKWGLFITDAFYAGVGGSDDFVETLLGNWPISADQQIQRCIDDYKSELIANRFAGPPLRMFLSDLFGKEKAQRVLIEAGILPYTDNQ